MDTVVNKKLSDLLKLVGAHKVYRVGLGHVIEDVAITHAYRVEHRNQVGSTYEDKKLDILVRDKGIKQNEKTIDFFGDETTANDHVKGFLNVINIKNDSILNLFTVVLESKFFRLLLWKNRKTLEEAKWSQDRLELVHSLIDGLPNHMLPTVYLPKSLLCADIHVGQKLYVVDRSNLMYEKGLYQIITIKNIELGYSSIDSKDVGVNLLVTLEEKNDTTPQTFYLNYRGTPELLPDEYAHSRQSNIHIFKTSEAAENYMNMLREKVSNNIESAKFVANS